MEIIFSMPTAAELKVAKAAIGRGRSALGCYKGVTEESLLVTYVNDAELELIKRIAFGAGGQESILLIHNGGFTYLIYADNEYEYIGKWTRVDSVLGLDGYTKFDDVIYTAVE